MNKVCFTCNKSLPFDNFHKHPQKSDGLHPSCKACRSKKSKKLYKKHSSKIKKKRGEYYKKNKDKIIERQKYYNKRRRETDIFYVISRRLRNRLYYALKNKKWKKNTHFNEYIGCDRDALIQHLESQFKDGMSWDNYGKWHIDHIIPLNSAKSENDLYRLCHYTNLQPLWAEENIKKDIK